MIKKPTLEEIKKACEDFKASGWTVCIYSRRRRLSLHGKPPVSFKEGLNEIKKCLGGINET